MTRAVPIVVSSVEAFLRLPIATVQCVKLQLAEPFDRIFREQDSIRLDLCPASRCPNSRLCFSDLWTPNHFERMGGLFVLPPGQTARLKSDVGRTQTIICNLSVGAIRDWLGEDLQWTNPRVEASANVVSANIERLMLRLGEEALQPGFASDTLSEALVAELAVELARYYRDVTDPARARGLAPWRLRMIDERLANLREPPTLSELARLCRLSVRQLTRSYLASRGETIWACVAHRRIERAKRLLENGEHVKSIAHSLGFASTSSFCYAFRKATGQAPGSFREHSQLSSNRFASPES